MLNLMSLKKERQKALENKSDKPKVSAAQIRIQKDLAELSNLPSTLRLEFPNPADAFQFELYITPDDGPYNGGCFIFSVKVNGNYPHDPPKVKCTQIIYHPNFDLDGNVCLNILREDWKPVLNIHSVLVGLLHLLLEPNSDDPLNKEAAQTLRENPERFRQIVSKTIKGGTFNDIKYDNMLHYEKSLDSNHRM